ncbi:GlmU family protein [Wenyingzhuangia sp. IMCC45574]
MNYILYDGANRDALLPFTYTRPVADIRIGILTIREKWEKYLGYTTTSLTEEYLEDKYPLVEMEQNIFINAGYLPSVSFFKAVKSLQPNQKVICDGEVIAFYTVEEQEQVDFDSYESIVVNDVVSLDSKWELFLNNDIAIRLDFEMLTEGRFSEAIPDYVQAVNKDDIFIEEGAILNPCILNASTGPIYIGKNAVVLDGALVRGAFALCEGSVLKMGAKIYGATTIGPKCKVGGEVKNSILFANSNKGHEGYLGDSVIGEWCNFGADTNISNLKNNYSAVKLWNYQGNFFEDTQQTFCGLMMGDHSKTGINTMLNTGTVVGVYTNIFGAAMPDKFVPSYSWGGTKDRTEYEFNKAITTAKRVMGRAGVEITNEEINILEEVFKLSKKYRETVYA